MAYIDKELFKQDIKMRYCNNCARPNEIKCRACHVDDMLGEIEDAPTADVEEVKWIDVNKRLPDEDGRYLVYRKFGIGNYKNIEVIRFENDSSYYKYVWNREVTHWRPLPEPPIEDGGKEE